MIGYEGLESMKIFMVAPYGSDPFFDTKRHIILEAASSKSLSIVFGPHRRPLDEDDCQITVQLIRSADAIIADLSYERPSCYFEVGFAQALAKPIHLIALNNTPIHQVLNRDSVKYYRDTAEYRRLIMEIMETMAHQV
jgi:hypothetical protein